MSATASFEIEVTAEDALAFARVSGDWNPLHTDPAHAAATAYRVPVLHGAFAAGLLSRLAGMHLPGRDCLLHSLALRFVRPVLPPARLRIEGEVQRDDGAVGEVRARVSDARSGETYAEGTYGFGRHRAAAEPAAETPRLRPNAAPKVLITGAGGGLGGALRRRLGSEAVTWRRGAEPPDDLQVKAIVHCGWPAPDNTPLVELADPAAAIAHHVTAPLTECLALARLLRERGEPGAMLVLIGSAFAEPGGHGYRMPLYSLAKGLLPALTRALAIELAQARMRIATLVFDVIDGGMNAGASPAVKQAHADRLPDGELPGPDEAAAQIEWLLANQGRLVSGAVVSLSGGALP